MLTDRDFNYIIGKSVDNAKTELPPKYSICVIEEDGQTFYKTMDFNPFRINVIVRNGKIYRIDGLN